MKRLFLCSILMVFIFTSQAFSFFGLMDANAVEVLLNRSDIIYNLDYLKAAENVSFKDTTALYRSHYDDRIGVTLQTVDQEDILKGVSVRLQIPLKEKITYNFYSVAQIKGVRIDDPGKDFMKSLVYIVDAYSMEVVDNPPVDEPRPGGDLPRDEEPKPVDGASVNYAQLEPVTIDTPGIDPMPAWTQTIVLSKDDVTISIACYGDDDESTVDLKLSIMNSQSISDQVKEDISQIFNFYGLGETVLNQLEENASVMEYTYLVESIDVKEEEFDFHSAMKTELDWLRDNGIVMGLTDQDVYDISTIAKQGTAGWNSRIVYSDGRWFPYYETPDPVLIYTATETNTKIDMDMPDGVAEFPPTSVTPAGKSITGWGKIKTSL